MAGLPTPKSYLSPADKERIHAELKQLEARRKATSNPIPAEQGIGYFKPQEIEINDAAMAHREMKLRNVLEKESPPHVSPEQRGNAYREYKTLVREYEDLALTKREQGYGYPKIMERRADAEIDFETAKRKCRTMEYSEHGQWVANRIKELAGLIDPDNPELRNLDNFRRAG